MPKVKIIDVAREAGVSLGTVSNALNHPERVQPDTRRAIEEAIRRLGYTPNRSARLLAGGRNTTLGLVLPHLNHGISLQIASGATAEAQRHGYDVVMMHAGDDPAHEERLLDYLVGAQMAGVLVEPLARDGWEPAARASVPVVYLDALAGAPGCYVTADNRAQGRIVAEHLLQRGAARIAVMGHAATWQARERLRGIHDALAVRPDVALEVLDAGECGVSGDGYTLGHGLARRDAATRPDAILGLSDVLGAGAIAGVIAAGLRVPDDMLIAGCDGNPLAWGVSPALTTCAPTGYEMGRKGVQLLIEAVERERVRDEEPRPLTHAGVPTPDAEPERVVETVRTFLIAHASTGGDGGIAEGAAAIPELNLGAYL